MNKTSTGLLCFLSTAFGSDCCFQEPIANAPLSPITCNGDWRLDAALLLWSAHQEGLEYAILNRVTVPVINPTPPEIEELNNLIDDDITSPASRWDFGLQLGLGYNTPCDGWSLNLLWTRYGPHSSSSASADAYDNETLVTLWSAFAPIQGEVNFARDIEVDWDVDLDFVDLYLERAYWISKRVDLAPFIGFRYADVDQLLSLLHKGGSWSPRTNPNQRALQGRVRLENRFKGIGLFSGLESAFHLGCGWKLCGRFGASIVYGHFKAAHSEKNLSLHSPHTKERVLQTESGFRASRAMIDLDIGVAWAARFCEDDYGVEGKLAWQQRILFHQNQLFSVVRIGDTATQLPTNPTGGNSYAQRSGNLFAQGLTLQLSFLF